MAITQISRIQHRRGLQQDLPQLASAELGWSIDQRRLFIGNGTLEEGAPTTGVTEILTEYSNPNEFFSLLNIYSFFGNSAGYSAQSGPSALLPTTRSFQSKFDDFVSIRDFGAVGDGVTNDTDAINRALTQIYKTGYNETQPLARRKIYFPGGTYLINDTLLVPPYAKLIGDGISSTVIKQTDANKSVIELCDTSFEVGANAGLGGATLPSHVEIDGFKFFNSNTTTPISTLILDSASNVEVRNTEFCSNASLGNLVSILNSVSNANHINFTNCRFLRGGNAIVISESNSAFVRVKNSQFDQLSNTAVVLGQSSNFVSIGNYFGNITSNFDVTSTFPSLFQFGDFNYNDPANNGIFLGNIQLTKTALFSLSSTPTVINIVSNSSAVIEYTISNSSARRFGSMQLANYNGTQTVFNDEYTETNVSVNANLFCNANSIIASVSSGTANFEFHIRRF